MTDAVNDGALDPQVLDSQVIDRVVEMAWEDRTPFEAIEIQFGLKEKQVIKIMRREMQPSSFRMWRKRVSGRFTKHLRKRDFIEGRFKSSNQKT
ncbi:MAG: TIGR03643 family protein [Microcoleaceae cyanobacterium]